MTQSKKDVLTTIGGWTLALFFVWAIIYTITSPDNRIICPPDNYCYGSGPGY